MGSLTVHVVNSRQRPVAGKKVCAMYKGSHLAGFADTWAEDFTDEDGVVEFDDAPGGDVEIYIGGVLELEVHVAEDESEDVTITI